MSITNREYYGTFHKYYIVGCAVQDRTTYGFVLDRLYSDQEVEDEEREGHDSTLRPKRLVVYYSDEEIDDQWGAISLDGWSYTYEPLAKRREATLTSRNGRLDEHFFKDSGQPDGLGKGYSFISVHSSSAAPTAAPFVPQNLSQLPILWRALLGYSNNRIN